MERPPVPTVGDLPVGLPGLLQGPLRGERDHRLELRAETLQAVQVQPRELHRGQLAGSDQLREDRHRGEGHLLRGPRPNHRTGAGPSEGSRWDVRILPGTGRIEVNRRGDLVRDALAANLDKRPAILLQAFQHHLPLQVGEAEPGDPRRVGDHLLGQWRLLQPGPENPRKERAGEAQTGEVGDKCAAVEGGGGGL